MKTESLEPLINKGFAAHRILLKLNSCRRFSCTIVHNSVNTFYFINNTICNLCKYFPWELCSFCCHEVTCVDRTKCNSIIVGSEVTHDTDRTHIGQCCKVLSKTFVNACLGNFFAVDVICFLYDLNFLFGNFADDTDTKTRAREWLTVYKVLDRKSVV